MPASEIEPFHAIAISRLAHQLKTEGASIIHMEFGQPSTGAPSKAIAKAHEILDAEAMGYWESPLLRRASPSATRPLRRHGRARADHPDLRRLAGPGAGAVQRVHARRPRRPGSSRLRRLSQQPEGPAPRTRRDRLRAGDRFQLTAEASRGSRPRPGRRHRRQPGQPDRHDHRARGAGSHRQGLPRARTSASSATRSITASATRAARPRCWSSRPTP
jgi:hypothetical protein